MKLLLAGFTLASLAAVGCGKDGTAGGPGATDPSTKAPLYGQADNTFTLTTASVTVKQAGAEGSVIGIKRGTNFSQDVTLAFADLPPGITATPGAPVIKKSESEVKFRLTAGENAAPGTYTVAVTGHPVSGGDATNQFQLTVEKKDTFTLSVPFWTTSLKQGEAKDVTIALSRDKGFGQDVTLTIDGLPKGVTVEPATAVIKNGESDVKFSLKAAADAPLGDFAVKITGHPTKGADATHDFKFTVAKK